MFSLSFNVPLKPVAKRRPAVTCLVSSPLRELGPFQTLSGPGPWASSLQDGRTEQLTDPQPKSQLGPDAPVTASL